MRTMVNRDTQHRRIRRRPHAGAAAGWPPRRVYAGRRHALAAQRAFFSTRATRQMTTRGRLEPWLGGAAMVACAACWGLLLTLLGG
jgi:hypothetical protein